MVRLLSILAISLWLSGCFVIDEIDKGNALIEQHSAGLRRKRAAEAAAAEKKAEEEAMAVRRRSHEPGVKEKLAEWWRTALEEKPVGPDPNDGIVSCTVRGRVVFTRQSDCELRGGRSKQLAAKSKTGG